MATAEGTAPGLTDAVDRIDRALAYDAPLRHRAEGLSWMVWGLATAATILPLGMNGPPDQKPLFVFWLFVIGSPIVAIVCASSVWILAGVSRPALAPSVRATGVAAFLAGLVLFGVVGFLVITQFESLGAFVLMSMLAGALPWALLAAVQWRRMTPPGRRATIGMGVLIAALMGLQAVIVGPTSSSHLWGVAVWSMPFFVGLVWIHRKVR